MKTNVERIEIIRGPSAIAYGSQAANGLVNVITKRGEGEFKGPAQVGFGRFGLRDQELGFDGRQGPIDYSLGFYHYLVILSPRFLIIFQ
jgi:vitamin B12 transporter